MNSMSQVQLLSLYKYEQAYINLFKEHHAALQCFLNNWIPGYIALISLKNEHYITNKKVRFAACNFVELYEGYIPFCSQYWSLFFLKKFKWFCQTPFITTKGKKFMISNHVDEMYNIISRKYVHSRNNETIYIIIHFVLISYEL